MSIRIRSYSWAAARSQASRPSCARVSCRPLSCSTAATRSRFSLESSTTSRRPPTNRRASARPTDTSAGALASCGLIRRTVAPSSGTTGRTIVNVLPVPTTLETVRSPPIALASRRLMVSPSPVPPKRRVVDVSACVKGSKIASSLSAGMPMPVSITSISRRIVVPSSIQRSRTVTAPCWVNLIALPTRLVIVCRRREGSARIEAGTGAGISWRSSMLFSRALTDSTSITSAITRCGSVSMHSSRSSPDSTFERSRMSSMSSSRWCPLRWMVSRYRAVSTPSRARPRRSRSVKPMIAFIGVRISWLMFARKSLLARLAASARSLASRNCTSLRSSSLTSSRLTSTPLTLCWAPSTGALLARNEWVMPCGSVSFSGWRRRASPSSSVRCHGSSSAPIRMPSAPSHAKRSLGRPVSSSARSPTSCWNAALASTMRARASMMIKPSVSVSSALRTRSGTARAGSSWLSMRPR